MGEKVGWVSTWNSRCGIACNSKSLIEENIEDEVIILAPDDEKVESKDGKNVNRCWSLNNCEYQQLHKEIQKENIFNIVIQFNNSLFDYHFLSLLIDKLILEGRQVFIIVHSTREDVNEDKKLSLLVDTFNKCTRTIIHTKVDEERLKKLGVTNTFPFMLGVLEPKKEVISPYVFNEAAFVVASYGFFLPNKGLIELIKAVCCLNREGWNIQLCMVNSRYPHEASDSLIEEAKQIIEKYKMSDRIFLETNFLEEEMSLAILKQADLIVLPYQKGDGSSAAARTSLNSGTLVMTSMHSVFDELKEITVQFSGSSELDIANAITEIVEAQEKSSTFDDVKQRAKNWCEERYFSVLSDKLFETIRLEKKC